MIELSRSILLVEDDEDDVFIFHRALKDAGISNPVQLVTHGRQAVEYLSGAGKYADRGAYPFPFIVFLDLKLPYLSGFDVLKWIRRRPELEPIIVVVLTSSDEDRDHSTAYQFGARSYIVKPPDGEQIRRLMLSLQSYWSRFDEAGPMLSGPA
jgi:CheY-like chemotaxis protein